MKITREELQAIENHMSNIPAVAGMYTPVLLAWCRALLDESAAAYRHGAEAMRKRCEELVKHNSHEDGIGMGSQRIESAIRALPISEEP